MKALANQTKGAWRPQEDQKLIAHVTTNGIRNWTQISKDAGLLRSGKSCRLRWMNYLRPDLKKGCFDIEEIKILLYYHQLLGNKWSTIASYIPGRTDNEIKNFWHTYIKKRMKSENVTKSRPQQVEDLKKNKRKRKVVMSNTSPGSEEFDFPILESYALNDEYPSCVLNDVSLDNSGISLSETIRDGEGHEERWINQNIFEEPFSIEEAFVLGMNYSSPMPFGFEFNSWENMDQDFALPEISSYADSSLLSAQYLIS